VITDEDMLEFLHHMQSKSIAAEHLFDALRDSHLLFIGEELLRVRQDGNEIHFVLGAPAGRQIRCLSFP
jgi:hypothetical protein